VYHVKNCNEIILFPRLQCYASETPHAERVVACQKASKTERDERTTINKEETLAVNDNCGSHGDETVLAMALSR
jgi:hypothetical protein